MRCVLSIKDRLLFNVLYSNIYKEIFFTCDGGNVNKAKYVNTMIGTVGDGQIEESHGGGKTYPGVCLPGGMVQLSPDTVTGGDNGSGYNYCHNTIEGFSFNHMSGIGWYGDLGNLQIMPVTNCESLRSGSNLYQPFKIGGRGWKSEFSHETEVTKAGYYSVELDRYNILTELTATEHTGLLRFTYPENEDAKLILNFSRRIGGKADFQKINIVSDNRIEGTIVCTPKGGGFGHGDGKITYNYNFVCEFSVPAKEMRFFSDEEFLSEGLNTLDGEDLGIVACFGKLSEKLVIRCAVSYVDLDGAKNNLQKEDFGFDFDKVRETAISKWENAFGILDVTGDNQKDLEVFYTCLYHVLLDPRISSDVDGRFAIRDKVYTADGYKQRTVFSGWDVYRSEFPLLAIIKPDMVHDEINSLLRIADINNSSFPRWELLGIDASCMVGDPGLIVIADAILKGFNTYDIKRTYEIAKASIFSQKELNGKAFHSIRPNCEEYFKDAFIPEKLSDTLEYLLADYTMAKLAERLGEKEDAEYFYSRVERYKDNYDKKQGFMIPRNKNGEFDIIEDRYYDDGCVESNIFQQGWFAPYDVKGLSELFGEKRTLELLEEFFDRAELRALWNDDYNHSNEPCHNITHYFSILGYPERTQYWTRRVQKESYNTDAYGFCGNEDVGQLSAWFVLSAIGFAQVCPGDNKYYINTPLFKKSELKLNKSYHSCKNAESFSVECDKDPLEYPYIKEAFYNGKKVDKAYLTYEEIIDGGVLKINLSKVPEKSF